MMTVRCFVRWGIPIVVLMVLTMVLLPFIGQPLSQVASTVAGASDQQSAVIVGDEPHSCSPSSGGQIIIGVLCSVPLLQARLLPLAETSLATQTSYFFVENNETHIGIINETRKLIASRPNQQVIMLDPLEDMKMSLRNAWADIPALKFMFDRHPNAAWFGILDDDTYCMMNAVRRILDEYDVSNCSKPLYVGDTLEWGVGGGWRLVRNTRTGHRRFIPSTRRKPVNFVVGGGGIWMNNAAVRKIYRWLKRCEARHFHPAGDIRMGACFQDAGIAPTRRREFVKDTHFRAIGELQQIFENQNVSFPACFHRMRDPQWYHALRRVETEKGDEIVQWGDLRAGFPNGGIYYDSLFFPKKYPNFTVIHGIRTMAPEVAKKWARVAKKYTLPPRGNPQADEW